MRDSITEVILLLKHMNCSFSMYIFMCLCTLRNCNHNIIFLLLFSASVVVFHEIIRFFYSAHVVGF